MGDLLKLDSGTLTPLLKKLEAKGYVVRQRSADDERRVCVALTPQGSKLQTAARRAHAAMEAELAFDDDDARLLRMTLNWLLGQLEETDPRRPASPEDALE